MQGMTPTLQLCSALARSMSTSRVQGFMSAALPHPLQKNHPKMSPKRQKTFSHGEKREEIMVEMYKTHSHLVREGS